MASSHSQTRNDLEPHLWVLTLALLSGYAMGGYAQKLGLDGTVPGPVLPSFLFMVPGILLAAFNFLAKNGPDRHMQALCIGFGIHFVWTVSAKGMYELDGRNALWRLLFSFAAGALVSTLMTRASKVLVWPAAIWFGFYSCLALPLDLGVSVWLGMFGAVVALIVTWMTGKRSGKRERADDHSGFGWSILRAPNRPTFAESFKTSDKDNRIAMAIEAFEAEVDARNTGEFVKKNVLYVDGWQLIPRTSSMQPSRELGPAGVRSCAYRVRRGFDEWWFVLHIKGQRESLTVQLDCSHRSRNLIVPIIVFGMPILAFAAWQSADAVASLLFSVIFLLGVLNHFGIIGTPQAEERDESRRTDRMTEYYPVILHAAATAIGVAQSGIDTMNATSSPTPAHVQEVLEWTRD